VKLFGILVFSAVAVSVASAGQIEIGQNSTNGISTLGLTSAYVTSVAQTAGWAEKLFSTSAFSGDTITGSSLNGVAETSAAGTGGTSTTPTSANGFQQFTDTNNGVVFAMDGDGMNYWASDSGSGTGATSIIIPVGVASLTGANILLNDYWGVNNSRTQNDTVLFSFNGGAVTDSITLTNGNQIETNQACAAASTTFTSINCTIFAQTASSKATDIAWSAQYVNTIAGGVPSAGTSGSLNLADLFFDLSAFTGDTLTSITITDNANGLNSSRLALGAVTVETAAGVTSATPEPTTWVLLVAGLGTIAFFGKSRRIQA
jgi:hypothetical protein